MRFYISYCFFILVSVYGCSQKSSYAKHSSQSAIQPEEVVIYWLNPYASYLISVDCDKLKLKSEVKKTTIYNRDEILRVFNYVNEINNLKQDTIFKGHKIDSRVLLEFKLNGEIIQRVCWCFNLLQKEGVVYKSLEGECEVEKFLYRNKIINRF